MISSATDTSLHRGDTTLHQRDDSFAPPARRLFHPSEPSTLLMSPPSPTFTLLGTAQDGGVPQAGCACSNCTSAHLDDSRRRFPVAAGVADGAGGFHLIEATRALPDQLHVWAQAIDSSTPIIPTSVLLTHVHLGHVDGIGQFGNEAMGLTGLPLIASQAAIDALRSRGSIAAFEPRPILSGSTHRLTEASRVTFEFVQVPHRDEESDTHAIIIRGPNSSILFLPDHDDWRQTLALHHVEDIRSWLEELRVDHALVDGTFWDSGELSGRDTEDVPHPPVALTLENLGERRGDDPEIHFIHLNHSNPLNAPESSERRHLESLGWKVAERGWSVNL